MNEGQLLSPACLTWGDLPSVMRVCSPGGSPEPENCEAVVTVGAVSAGEEQSDFPSRIQ